MKRPHVQFGRPPETLELPAGSAPVAGKIARPSRQFGPPPETNELPVAAVPAAPKGKRRHVQFGRPPAEPLGRPLWFAPPKADGKE
jgi:hypothetical protein